MDNLLLGFCISGYHARDRGYNLLRALGFASSDSTHKTVGMISYGHWVLHLVISRTSQGVRFVTALGSASCDSTHKTGGTICYGQ